MKTLFLLSLVFLTISWTSYAQQDLVCDEAGSGTDNGYRVVVAENFSSASVEEKSIAGDQTVADLTCSAAHSRHPAPDQEHVLVKCFEPKKRDAGYSVMVYTGGYAGITRAELFEISFSGSKKIADLYCR